MLNLLSRFDKVNKTKYLCLKTDRYGLQFKEKGELLGFLFYSLSRKNITLNANDFEQIAIYHIRSITVENKTLKRYRLEKTSLDVIGAFYVASLIDILRSSNMPYMALDYSDCISKKIEDQIIYIKVGSEIFGESILFIIDFSNDGQILTRRGFNANLVYKNIK